jgi:glycosyltransferase involved in cell wall biosynthesis
MNCNPRTAPVTAVLFCFRQEHVVEAAVRSIFSQTVQPAEIILSDDASPDGSFAVLQKLAGEYQGTAKIILRKTQGTSGWFAHINACMALASHEHVIVFAGDDISLPDRIEWFAAEIEEHPEARLLWSRMERMTPDGKATGHAMGASAYTPGRLRGGVGASQCWHKELLTFFGDLPPVQAAEDIVLPFRAWLLGGLRHIPEPLVLWRDRDYRQLSRDQLDWTYEVRASLFRINAAEIIAADLDRFLQKHLARTQEFDAVAKRLARETLSVKAEHETLSKPSRPSRLVALVCNGKTIGFKRARRIWQDQILALPAYLDSAYPRAVRRWLPRFVGLAAGGAFAIFADMRLPVRVAVSLLLIPIAMEVARMTLRAFAKLRWKPA